MLICDLCGGKNSVASHSLSFEVRSTGREPIGTLYSQDICEDCYTKLYNMVHVYNNSPALHTVLSNGLDLKPNVMRTSNRGD